MNYAFCIAAVAPIRKEPSHRSEMISQLLFGETGRILEVAEDFTQIECAYDGYIGWVQSKQLSGLNYTPKSDGYFTSTIQEVYINETPCRIGLGTPYYNHQVILDKYRIEYPFQEQRILEFNEQNTQNILEQYMHVPYLWGGKSVFGIDCSGLSQQVMKLMGIFLPRDAYQQIELGEEVPFLSEAVCGDLAFFDNEEGNITHVGILIDNSTIVHASGTVRLDKIDNGGIIQKETGERTHKLRIVKRIK